MRRWFIVLLLLIMGSAGPVLAGPVSMDAMLILASNDPAPLDRRLERVEYKLRPLFRFEYYRFMGEGTGLLNLPGETSIALIKHSASPLGVTFFQFAPPSRVR